MEHDLSSSFPIAEDPALMTLDQLGAYLQIDPRTISRLAREGKIPCHKVGSQFRFLRSAVLHALLLHPPTGSPSIIDGSTQDDPIPNVTNTPRITIRRRLGPRRSTTPI
jgi:excisionase family DNA binding protein